MNGIVDIFGSERGVFSVLVLVAVTVLTAFGVVKPDQWIDFVKWLMVTFIGSKTISHAVEMIRGANQDVPKASSQPPATPSPTDRPVA